ncbi:G-type lectin S-receptor-like serine/threonine-protein kinase LECRK2 [Macadamia integrifolia]|uniref:G-type lectin S-receptor-like serine/threonine-protein kinase LECRK2 n=1 Tax=Macadamia integrifolia TaxID=60698 RepID=UPI001C53230A|nr:G-type lectin S-receptor-like serine/threonine-protein kinase LECRK2 [Macadamia integrifolia]XP_042478232.1 G-type lectin S-receptor-like serine/threonine-protein kinase LECRK2 [Macadamia integrifolia]
MSFNAAFPHILFFSSLLFPLLAVSQANNVTLGTHLIAGDGGSWTSPSKDFAFGFRRLEDNNFFLLCIWFYQIPNQTIVWYVDGFGNPAPKNSKIELTTGGQLQLTNPTGQELWKAEIINSSKVAYAAMLDNGNFVLQNKEYHHIWESFSNPTDTILPGQILQVGVNLSSRLTYTNYSQGRFQLQLVLGGKLQINPVALPSYTTYDPYFTIEANPPENRSTLVFNESGSLYIKRSNGSIEDLSPIDTYPIDDFYHRATLDVHGAFYLYTHPRSSGWGREEWSIEKSFPGNVCDITGGLGSGACGFNSYCRAVNGIPVCECPPEYSQIDPNSSLSGCKPNIPLVCEEDESGFPEALFEFTELNSTDWPLADYERLEPVSEEECKNSCLLDCYCGVVIYRNVTCWKKKLPLSNGRFSASDTGKALFKLRRASSSSTKRKNQIIVILVGSLGSSAFINFLLLSGICLIAFFVYQKRPKRSKKDLTISETNLRSFTYKELEEATNGFKEELGKGAFGIVYKGLYPLGSRNLVAVKRLDKVVQEGEKEFKTEVNVIGQTHHKNLVRLFGYCDDGSHRLLVYEFMSNGSLASFLFGLSRPHWDQRTQIAIGIARGLFYLHEECSTQIIHCDIKPQNILLDDFFRPRISDFGLAKLLMPDQVLTLTGVRGTRGYVAPEWFRRTPITAKVDVYSFGVMLLEIISCRKSVETAWEGEEKALLTNWAYDCYREGKIEELVEKDEEAMRDEKRLLTFVMIAIWCIQEEPSLRPTMKKVLQMLEAAVAVPCPPRPFPFSSSC